MVPPFDVAIGEYLRGSVKLSDAEFRYRTNGELGVRSYDTHVWVTMMRCVTMRSWFVESQEKLTLAQFSKLQKKLMQGLDE